MNDYLTADATPTAKGAWNEVDPDTNNIDCAARAVGPRLVWA